MENDDYNDINSYEDNRDEDNHSSYNDDDI